MDLEYINITGQFSGGCFFEVVRDQDNKPQFTCSIWSSIAHNHPDPKLAHKHVSLKDFHSFVELKSLCDLVDSDNVNTVEEVLDWLSSHQCW